MCPPSDRPGASFHLTAEERARLRTDIDLDAFEQLLAVLPPAARPLLLRLAAKHPDLLAIWDAAPALRDDERGPVQSASEYRVPKLQTHDVPQLEDVTISDPVLQAMLRIVLRPRGEGG
jgi:hypothetical protein